ncbi:serine/threonine-protein kinase [Embleya hyalina]|uniref:non-specific serine/threonine protein kinase n=1 Tax=Embleya hyalina TaxID=516124 RepID=A0A401YG82_9ACTN|nr:serine/threonine-protein kinase [Embleya hyalina]GCD93568.1 protein kinase [Embleya hyalina]
MTPGIPGRRVIDGRFELLERLGGGGMGLVWRARDLALEREVALKEVRPPDPALLEDDPTAARMLRERVLREARSLARLNHPHVVTIHHIVDAAEVPHPWLVMELVPGGSLHDRLANGPIAPAEAAAIGRGVLSALSAAHAAGIHHRDVKPGNVLLRADGSPVLTDFGIAALRESTSLTATGDLIGSPEYIAPERIRGEEDNAASDLWSLGMMLYVAVEGEHPLRRATSLATLAAVLTETVPAPGRAGALRPVLEALLVRDPAARPDAARLDALLAAAAGEPGARPSSQHTTSALPVADALAWQPGDLGGGRAVDPGWDSGSRSGLDAAFGADTGSRSGPAWTGADRVGPAWAGADRVGGGSNSGSWQGASADSSDEVPVGSAAAGTPGAGSPYGSAFTPATPESAARQRARRNRIVGGSVVATALVGTLVAVLLASQLRDSGSDSAGAGAKPTATRPTMTPDARGSSPDDEPTEPAERPSPTRSASKPAADKENLMTPAGIRGVIESMKPVIGGTKVKSMSIHDSFASVDAPVPGNARLQDRYSYRDGKTTKDTGFGRTGDDEKTIDLTKVNWDALPALFAKADKELGITTPKTRYVIVDLGLVDRVPSLKVYVGDDYGSGYLRADLDGKVLKMYPR